ncbi:hypothetical protein I307_03044 [Cryptococcus deuterogattii 99/473]|uniref:Unplaced genomic scaffold supercont1.12, whole genome shotgun sequence n=1 Tax=Cryptococcus deuterogattii Ram5 TaxID=1296110 RepID=A0A0D0T0N5_9TREE|nr:hypothetical protein I309_02282 [Cryptococcus deuterogattii LA55]KIR39212.1 hypothetical protein I313_04811 [Cryptococcus deuterogattii Ram5]KIR94634.1 hypothetical protein I304_00951 [Cryptococcus deuterogattii CBS 10090]KIS00841.1 hypothetical protein L804_02264 [Cryptococcus deuterogattii 2001/935-1]KIY57550.1 hypothetical protein I307_03044 [Cryptococcus deuterogattii 99/473]
MSSNTDKKIVIFTATGSQGNSVARYLSDAGYKIVALTRDTESKGAKALKAKGYEVARADNTDPESYKPALQGAYGAFVNTDFWSIFPIKNYDAKLAQEEEFKQGTAALQACKDAGLKHVVYSTLDDGTGCVHWQSKAEVSKWAKNNDIPITNLVLTFYYENVVKMNACAGNGKEPNTFILNLPLPDDSLIPGFPVAQTGLWVKTAFDDPKNWIGKDIYACTDVITVKEMAEQLSAVSGKTVKSNGLSVEVFKSEDFQGKIGKELWDNMDLFYRRFLKRDVPESMRLAPGAWNFEAWAKQNDQLKKVLGF